MSTRDEVKAEFERVQQEAREPKRPRRAIKLYPEDFGPEDFAAMEVAARKGLAKAAQTSKEKDEARPPGKGRTAAYFERNRRYVRERAAGRREQERARHRAYYQKRKALRCAR